MDHGYFDETWIEFWIFVPVFVHFWYIFNLFFLFNALEVNRYNPLLGWYVLIADCQISQLGCFLVWTPPLRIKFNGIFLAIQWTYCFYSIGNKNLKCLATFAWLELWPFSLLHEYLFFEHNVKTVRGFLYVLACSFGVISRPFSASLVS